MNTFHILPADDASQGGSGSPTDPLRIHGPRHFDDLLDLLDLGSLRHVEEVRLGPGVYWTRGPWAHAHYCITRPFALVGETPVYSDLHAVIKLHSEAVFETDGKARPDTLVFRAGVGWRNNQTVTKWRIEDIEFDGNEQVFPGEKYVIGCLNIWGNQPTVRNVVTRGCRGHRQTDASDPKHFESFGICCNNRHTGDSGGYDGGGLIEDCASYDDGDRNPYFSGIYPGFARNSSTLLPTVVRRCRAVGTGSKPSGIAFSLQGRSHYYDCTAENVNFAWYNDVDRVEDCVVDACRVKKLAYCALALRCSMKNEWRSPDKRKVTVVNTVFEYAPSAEWIGLWIDDVQKTGARIDGIEMSDVEFKGSLASSRNFTAGVFDSQNIGSVIIDGKFPAGWTRKVTAGSSTEHVILNARG